jgi:hypothetical protein
MKEYLNKKVVIAVNSDKSTLTYTAVITNVSKTHITFKDKFGLYSSFKISEVKQISEIKEETKNEVE